MSEARKYTDTHEWVLADGDTATIGITEFAQEQLGDVVFVELPEPGTAVSKHQAFGVIESVKVAADLVAPVSGEVLTKNEALADAPELINSSPQSDGWIITVKLATEDELDDLLDEATYLSEIAHED